MVPAKLSSFTWFSRGDFPLRFPRGGLEQRTPLSHAQTFPPFVISPMRSVASYPRVSMDRSFFRAFFFLPFRLFTANHILWARLWNVPDAGGPKDKLSPWSLQDDAFRWRLSAGSSACFFPPWSGSQKRLVKNVLRRSPIYVPHPGGPPLPEKHSVRFRSPKGFRRADRSPLPFCPISLYLPLSLQRVLPFLRRQ